MTKQRVASSRPPTPGAVFLERVIRPSGLTQKAAAARLGISYPRMNEIVNGKRSVTPETALRLARFSGTEPAYWLELQLAVDLWDARRATDPADLASIEPAVPADATRLHERATRLHERAARYAVARVFPLGEEPEEDLRLGPEASERLAMVEELSRQAWELSRAPRRRGRRPES